QLDSILQGQLKLAVVDELIDLRRVGDDRIRNVNRSIWRDQIRECPRRPGVFVFGYAQRYGNWRCARLGSVNLLRGTLRGGQRLLCRGWRGLLLRRILREYRGAR